MACEQWRGKLDLYSDGELAPADEAALRAHLNSCAACAVDVLDRVQLKRSVHAAGKRYEPSAQLRAQIAKTVAKTTAKKATSASVWGWRIIFVPAVVMLIFALALSFYVGRGYAGRERAARQRVYSELADRRVATRAR